MSLYTNAPRARVDFRSRRSILAVTAIMAVAVWAMVGCIAPQSALAGQVPEFIYLTWQGDTSSTITVNCHTNADVTDCIVLYDTVSHGDKVDAYKHRTKGTSHQIEGLEKRRVHWIALTDLTPGTTYHFVVGSPEGGFSAEQKFRTIPANPEQLRFVTGGDMGTSPEVAELLKQAALTNPDFALIGGDIAYVNARVEKAGTWDEWLRTWCKNMVTPDGCIIPMGLAIGNHETRPDRNKPLKKAPFFFRYFAQNGDLSYFSRSFGGLLHVSFLDTAHTTPHGGKQAEWLRQDLAGVPKGMHKAAIYHVPLFPSHRPYNGHQSVSGRNAWTPLFDQFGLDVAFENHDHTLKRTVLIKNGKEDPTGTLYLGDGCWGRDPRPISDPSLWYLAKAESKRHFWVVDVTRERMTYHALDQAGKELDRYPIDSQ